MEVNKRKEILEGSESLFILLFTTFFFAIKSHEHGSSLLGTMKLHTHIIYIYGVFKTCGNKGNFFPKTLLLTWPLSAVLSRLTYPGISHIWHANTCLWNKSVLVLFYLAGLKICASPGAVPGVWMHFWNKRYVLRFLCWTGSICLQKRLIIVVFEINGSTLHESSNGCPCVLLLTVSCWYSERQKTITREIDCRCVAVQAEPVTLSSARFWLRSVTQWFLSKFPVCFLRLSILASGQRFLLLSQMFFFFFFSRMVRPPILLPTATTMRLRRVFIPALSSRLSCLS